jgi:hypothetical protein
MSYFASGLIAEVDNADGACARLLKDRLYNPDNWKSSESIQVTLAPIMLMVKIQRAKIVSPQKVWDMSASKQADPLARLILVRYCAMGNAQPCGMELLSAIWKAANDDAERAAALSVEDRALVLKQLLTYCATADGMLKAVQATLTKESDARLRLLECLFLIDGRSGVCDAQSLAHIATQVDEKTRERYSVAISCAKAYLGDEECLREVSEAVAAGRVPELMSIRRIPDLIRGTDYDADSPSGIIKLAQWAVSNMDALTYDDAHRWWSCDPK